MMGFLKKFKPELLQDKILLGTVGGTLFMTVIWLIAIGIPYWVHLTIPSGSWRNASRTYIISHHSGLWRICRTEMDNSTAEIVTRTYCNMTKFFPSEEAIKKDPDVDMGILNYSRSETAFAVISLLFSVLAQAFAVYSIQEPRYMFKRLTAALYLITTVCIVICVEVMINSVNYERQNLPSRHPEGSYLSYGVSFGLSWLVLIVNAVAAIIFLVCSGKRKGHRARSVKEARENEPVVLGRI